MPLPTDATGASPLEALGNMSPIGSPLMKLFEEQMVKAGPRLEAAETERKSALKMYQDSIREKPKGITGNDLFNAIGAGYYSNPNWGWNPSEALASGFKKMNDMAAERHAMELEAPVLASKVGYDDAKDYSNSLLNKNIGLQGMAGLVAQDMRTTGSMQRLVYQQQAAVFKQAYDEALKTGKGAEAIALASAAVEEFAVNMGLPKPDPARMAALAQGTVRGAPPAAAPGPVPPMAAPRPRNPAMDLESGQLEDILNNLMRSPGEIPPSVNLRMRSSKAPDLVTGEATPEQLLAALAEARKGAAVPPPAATPRPAVPPRASSGPGETAEERNARVQGQKKAEATGAAAGKESTEAGLKYKSQLIADANAALEANRTVDQVEADLNKFGSAGKLGNVRKTIAQWKVALGIANDEDTRDAASAENADKLSFDLATKTIRAFTPRGTQMELIRAVENNPNLLMTPEGRKEMIAFLKARNQDSIEKAKHFQKWIRENSLTDPTTAGRYLEHDFDWLGYQEQMQKARLGAQKPADVMYKGQRVTVTPYWDEATRSLWVTLPDGTKRKVKSKNGQ